MLGGGYADEEYRDPDVVQPKGLVAAEKAAHGNDLVLERQALMDSTKGLSDMMFFEPSDDDDPLVERWANAQEFADAMCLAPGVLPTEQAADAWFNMTVSARLQKWAPRLEAAGL